MHKITYICVLERQYIHKHTNILKNTNLGTHILQQNPPFKQKINHTNRSFFKNMRKT